MENFVSPPGWRNLKTDILKYGHESCGTQTRERKRWSGSAANVNYRPYLSSERAFHVNKPSTV
jgi:hypothetical protein